MMIDWLVLKYTNILEIRPYQCLDGVLPLVERE